MVHEPITIPGAGKTFRHGAPGSTVRREGWLAWVARRGFSLLVAAPLATALTSLIVAAVIVAAAPTAGPGDPWGSIALLVAFGVIYGSIGAGLIAAPWLLIAERWRCRGRILTPWLLAGAAAGASYVALGWLFSGFDGRVLAGATGVLGWLLGVWPAALSFQGAPDGGALDATGWSFMVAPPLAGAAAGWAYGRLAFGKG